MLNIFDIFENLVNPSAPAAPVESNVIDATQKALERLQTTGVAGGNALPSNAIEGRVKSIDLSLEWRKNKQLLSFADASLGRPAGNNIWTGSKVLWDVIYIATSATGLKDTPIWDLFLGLLINFSADLTNAKYIRCCLMTALSPFGNTFPDGTLATCDMRAYWSPSPISTWDFNWSRCPEYDWSITDPLYVGDTLGGSYNTTPTTFAGACKAFPVSVPFGKLLYIPRNMTEMAPNNGAYGPVAGYTLEVY